MGNKQLNQNKTMKLTQICLIALAANNAIAQSGLPNNEDAEIDIHDCQPVICYDKENDEQLLDGEEVCGLAGYVKMSEFITEHEEILKELCLQNKNKDKCKEYSSMCKWYSPEDGPSASGICALDPTKY